jgi:urocanate hydratase
MHNRHGGGYYPVGLSLEQSNQMMAADPHGFWNKVTVSLRRQVAAINGMARPPVTPRSSR